MKHLVKAKLPKILPIDQHWFKAPRKGINKGTQTDLLGKHTKATQTETSSPGPLPEPQRTEKESFYCLNCGFQLFRAEDIHHRSKGSATEYIFVRPRKAAATVDRQNRAKCEFCNVALGGFCNYAGDFTRPRIRFCRHLISTTPLVNPPISRK